MHRAAVRVVIAGVTVMLASHSLQAESFKFTDGETGHWMEQVARPTQDRVSQHHGNSGREGSDDATGHWLDQVAKPAQKPNSLHYVGTTRPESYVENISFCRETRCCEDKVGGCRDEAVCGWLRNTEIQVGVDAYQNIGDTARSLFNPLPFANKNNQGIMAGFNTGIPLGDSKIHGQIGANYGVYDWRGRLDLGSNSATSSEQQLFLTAGLFKRSDVCQGDRISFGMVYDHLFAEDWGIAANSIDMSQLRGIVGYALNESNEIGFWGAVGTQDDSAILGQPGASPPSQIHAMNHGNIYLKHNWAFGGNTMLYFGAIDNSDIGSWQTGAMNTAPLSKWASVYGNFAYVAPSASAGLGGAAEETWNVSAGLIFYLGRNSQSSTVSGNQGMPLLPVASNGTFLITD